MEFDWDDGKHASNVRRRQLPFEVVKSLFDGKTLERLDDRRDYREKRIQAYGEIEGRLFVCVYTDRVIAGHSIRWIISLRKANKREIRRYNEWIKDQVS